MSHPLIHFGSEATAPPVPADGRGLLIMPGPARPRVHPVTHEAIEAARRARPQPKKLRARASRSTFRASRSLPYPDGKYERRRQQREQSIERRIVVYQSMHFGAHNAERVAVVGSGRRDVVD